MNNTNNSDIRSVVVTFRNLIPLLSRDLNLHLETTCNAVEHNLIATVEGFQITDKFVWESVNQIHNTVIPLLKDNLQKEWQVIYDFLYQRLGQDVENHYSDLKVIAAKVEEFRTSNKLDTLWGIEFADETFLTKPYPNAVTQLIYNENSGWGHYGTVNLATNCTYGDIWIAANSLFINSGDNLCKVISSLQYTKEGLVVIFDIEK